MALYFGYGRGGHFLRGPGILTTDPQEIGGFPWSADLLDTGLLINHGVPDVPDGRVHWTCGGRPDLWHAFFWWDRSGDARGASNSGFYVQGFSDWSSDARRLALGYACSKWPDVVARQKYPLVLVEHS